MSQHEEGGDDVWEGRDAVVRQWSSFLLEGGLLIPWIILQGIVAVVLDRFRFPKDVVFSVTLFLFQVLFAASTLTYVALRFYREARILYMRVQADIRHERQKIKRADQRLLADQTRHPED